MASRKAADAGSASYDSSSSASSDDDVLITKKHRQKLQGLNTPRVKPEAAAPAPAAAPPPVTKSPLNKPDHICGVCERDGGDLVVCTGSCVSAFHVACLPRAHRDAASSSSTEQWKCPSCVTNTHVCFHCKERGRVVVSDASASPDDAASHSADETNTKPALRAVVKCRALSCGKFYHQKCIAKLPLARIAGARFICPLHTCAACEQSGAKKEPVRCTRCPVAYHTSCLPRSGVVPLPGKRIICPKHEGQALVMEDEEEKERAHEEEGEVVEPVVAKQAPAIARITAQEDQDADVSVAASSPRTEENENEAEDDARSETSTSATTSSGVKKHSKSSKKDKKKKKKKKKKDKKSKDKERSSKGGDEASSEKEDGGKKVKRSSKSSSSNKAGRRTDEDDGHGDDTGEERDEKKTSSAVHTASEDDDEEEKATVVVTESVAVKKEESVVPSSSPQPESQDSHESTKGATESADVASAEEEPAAVMNAFDDEPKPEPEREEQVAIATPPSKIERADDVKPMSPLPQSNEEPVVSETLSPHGDHEEPREDEKTSESLPALDVSESTERASPSPAVKNDPPYRTDDDSRDHLTVQIPEISMSGLATGDDGEVDEDSGSGSGSQSNKARNSDKHTTEDVVKEKPSGGSSRSKKSKKKQRKGGGKGGGDESVKREGDAAEPREEAKWVQCDDCKKWRTVAKEIDLDAMPETWSCTMNTWNKAFASCDVPEEVVETKKSSSKPTKRAALGEVGTPVLKKAKLTKQNSVPEIVQTPASEESIATAVPEKEAKIVKKADKDSKKRKLKLKLREKYGEVHWVQCENKQCGKWRVVPSSASTLPSVWYCSLNTWAPELASCSAANPPEVEAYLSKSQSKKPSGTRPPKRQRGPDNGDQTNLAAASAQGDAVAPARPAGIKPIKNSGGGKSATPTAHASGGSVGSGGTAAGASVGGASGTVVDARAGAKALTGVKSVVLEWAQCEKCLKWRKLPAHIKSSTLPDKWFCSMNHWDPPSRASCAVPQEDDQEPLVDASPLPSSQNWYPMPGQVSGNTSTGTGTTSAMRSKRGKLSYSELLYASTGQLRKTYTSESSTLSFEYEGTVYHRDDQYNKSSLYLSPLTTNKLTGEPIDPQRKDKELSLFSNTSAQKALVDKVATVILSTIDLRRDFAITEIVDSVLNDGMVSGEGDLSLSVITTAIAQLVACGELEKVDRSQTRHEWPPSSGDTTTASILLRSLSSQPAFYRKVPKRPLKALKAWKLAVRL